MTAEDKKAIEDVEHGGDPLRDLELKLVNGTPEEPVNPDTSAISDPYIKEEVERAEAPGA